jgi:hypothetical protein
VDHLTEFRSLVAQAKRKPCKQPEDEAIIAAGAAIEYWLRHYSAKHQPAVFDGASGMLEACKRIEQQNAR